MMNKEKFGSYLCGLRKDKNLTQAELAEKIHVTDKAISKWERGIGLPDINNIEPLADALGVSVLDLMKSGNPLIDSPDKAAVDAVKNTITLADIQKKKFRLRMISLLMLYIGLKASYSVFISTSALPENYNHLPMPIVYMLLAVYMLLTIAVACRAFYKPILPANRRRDEIDTQV